MNEQSVVCEACSGLMLRRNGWVLRCPACGFFASTLTPGAGTGIGGLERLRRSNFEKLLDRLEKLKPLRGTSLLEVGSARGWFLEAAARRGAQVYGIEPEAANANLARAAGLPVEVGYFPDGLANAGPYDIIVFNDVFEHIPHPSALIGDIEARLAPGGLLVINLPSSGGIFFRLARLLESFGIHGPAERLWQKGFPSPHVSYFKPENLWLLVERRSGLSNESIFSLASVTREGLSSRIKSSHKGTRGALLLAGVWALSFALPLLPADIQVSVFRKPAA